MRITKRNNDEIEIDLVALFKLFWSKKVLIVLSAIICGALVLFATFLFVKPQYTATVYMYANNSKSTDSSKNSISSSDMTASAKLVDTYSAIICRDSVLDQVIQETGTNYTAKQLRDRISISAVNSTEVFKVSVKCESPEEAMIIANSIARVAIVRISEIIDGCSTKIVDEAKVPNMRSSPSYSKNAIIGALLGVFLCVGFLLVSALLDKSINEESDFKAFGYPVIGNIPEFNSAAKI